MHMNSFAPISTTAAPTSLWKCGTTCSAMVCSSCGNPAYGLAVSGHRFGQVLGNLVEERCGREPLLIRADQQRQVLRHVTRLNCIDADLLQRERELRQRRIVVELGTMLQPAGPREN